MLNAERALIFGYRAEACDIGVGESVGNLQRHAEEHREDEEYRHAFLLEQLEGVESEGLSHRASAVVAHRAWWERQRVGTEEQTHDAAGEELVVVLLIAHQVDKPHHADETDGAECAYRRKHLHGVESGTLESAVGNGVGEREGRHVERHAAGVECEQRCKLRLAAGGHAVVARGNHECGGDDVARAQQLLCRDVAVGEDSHQRRHEERHDALHCVKHSDVFTHSDAEQVGSH